MAEISAESWHLAESAPGISRYPPGRAVGLRHSAA